MIIKCYKYDTGIKQCSFSVDHMCWRKKGYLGTDFASSLVYFVFLTVNKHKPWIETTYHGIVTENDDKVLLDPPLIALDKDAPLRYAGESRRLMFPEKTTASPHLTHIIRLLFRSE